MRVSRATGYEVAQLDGIKGGTLQLNQDTATFESATLGTARYFDLKAEGALIREAVNASLDANVRTPEIQVEGGAKYGTREVGQWIVDYIKAK